jgi:uncharacterized membrane protein (UPF0127 family)
LKYCVRNLTRGTSLGSSIDAARTSACRRRGLLGRAQLKEGEGLWIVPCESIHTFFMRFAIDVVYLDRRRRVRKIVSQLLPWRLSLCLAAHSVLELPNGCIDRGGIQKGDQLEFQPIA